MLGGIMKNLPQIKNYSIIPTTIDEALKQAEVFYSISMLKKGYPSAKETFLAIMIGGALGIPPVVAVQNISIINGRASIWGDLVPALVYRSGLLEKHEEIKEGSLNDKTARFTCVVKRKGFGEKSETFSAEDAARAGLWGRSIWKNYPWRMLKMRARSWAFRDNFADTLCGLSFTEEVIDIPGNEDDPTVIAVREELESRLAAESKPTPSKKVKEKPPAKETSNSKVLRSNLFDEIYSWTERGTVLMESGVEYSKDEMKKLSNMSEDERKKVHSDKIEKLKSGDKE